MRAPRETLWPFRDERGEGSIVFDPQAWPQTPDPALFDPAHWGTAAQPVAGGGRGAAWFVDAPNGPMVLRHYLRGGWMARFSRDAFVWRGESRVRSFQEFRLLQALHGLDLPVPVPLAAAYWRNGRHYRAALLLRRIPGTRAFGRQVIEDAAAAPWAACGRLVARFHRAGLDHADLNADNLLFDGDGNGWMIDFDKSGLRNDDGWSWRTRNLARLQRSLQKLAGAGAAGAVDAGFAQLRAAYDQAMGAAPLPGTTA